MMAGGGTVAMGGSGWAFVTGRDVSVVVDAAGSVMPFTAERPIGDGLSGAGEGCTGMALGTESFCLATTGVD